MGFIFTPRFPPLAACSWFRPGKKETEENTIIIKVTYINIEFPPSSAEVPQKFHGTLLITLHDLTNKITPFAAGCLLGIQCYCSGIFYAGKQYKKCVTAGP